MIVIGLTGGIGSGKSTVAGYLAELGAVVMDADKMGHEVYLPGTPGHRDVVNAFGHDILDSSGMVDRKKLGRLVFSDSGALVRLNAIVHPRILHLVRNRIKELQSKEVPAVVVEAALLIEAGWAKSMDEVWLTVAPEKTVIQRLMGDRSASEDEIMARIIAQLSNDERKLHADIVIENNGSMDELRNLVGQLWYELFLRRGSP